MPGTVFNSFNSQNIVVTQTLTLSHFIDEETETKRQSTFLKIGAKCPRLIQTQSVLLQSLNLLITFRASQAYQHSQTPSLTSHLYLNFKTTQGQTFLTKFSSSATSFEKVYSHPQVAENMLEIKDKKKMDMKCKKS